MDDKRLAIHQKLVDILGSDQVYFQPPENVKMSYPAIVYSRRTGNTTHADDMPYTYHQVYDVTYISRDPDDGFVRKAMMSIRGARYDRHFISDNLHHDSIVIPEYN